ncbi:MAG: hypothetical protein ACRDQB_01380, partial [Thermocrispum sp.]
MIDHLIDSVGDSSEAAAVEIRRWGAGMGDGPGPCGHRDVPFSVKVEGPATSIEPILPYATGKTFLNFMPDPGKEGSGGQAVAVRRPPVLLDEPLVLVAFVGHSVIEQVFADLIDG